MGIIGRLEIKDWLLEHPVWVKDSELLKMKIPRHPKYGSGGFSISVCP
jgi:hypothetical protein